MAEFHKQLLKAMDLKGITQKELCKKTNIPKSAMSQYMSGKFKPKQKRTYLLAKALDVNEAWLMGFDNVLWKEKTKKKNKQSHFRKQMYLCDRYMTAFRQGSE